MWRTCSDACCDRKLVVPFKVGGEENVPGIPGACATRNFMFLVRGPLSIPNQCIVWLLYTHVLLNLERVYNITMIPVTLLLWPSVYLYMGQVPVSLIIFRSNSISDANYCRSIWIIQLIIRKFCCVLGLICSIEEHTGDTAADAINHNRRKIDRFKPRRFC